MIPGDRIVLKWEMIWKVVQKVSLISFEIFNIDQLIWTQIMCVHSVEIGFIRGRRR